VGAEAATGGVAITGAATGIGATGVGVAATGGATGAETATGI